MTSNHLRKAKDLERRITRQQQQQQQFDQGHDSEDMNEPGSLSSHGTTNNTDRSFDMESLRHALSSDQQQQHGGSSTPTIGESYAVLSQNVRMNIVEFTQVDLFMVGGG